MIENQFTGLVRTGILPPRRSRRLRNTGTVGVIMVRVLIAAVIVCVLACAGNSPTDGQDPAKTYPVARRVLIDTDVFHTIENRSVDSSRSPAALVVTVKTKRLGTQPVASPWYLSALFFPTFSLLHDTLGESVLEMKQPLAPGDSVSWSLRFSSDERDLGVYRNFGVRIGAFHLK